MGRRYSFDLFYPAAVVEAGLRAMDPFLPAAGRRRPQKPAALSESPATTVLSSLTPDAPVFFRTSLLFPADEHVRAFGPNRDEP
jgi:hypothetical protein